MAYCGPKGIPLSAFLAWSEADQDAALAWQGYENRRCHGCGTHPDDWNEKQGGSRFAWHAEHYQCPGCVKREQHSERPQVKDAGPGIHVRLAPGPNSECESCAKVR